MALPRRARLLCMACQWRSFSTSYRRLAQEAPKAANAVKANAALAAAAPAATPGAPKKVIAESPLGDAPRSYGKRVEKFTPQPLPRPIGLPYPPEVGENTGIDARSIKERRDDFVDYSKHLERRKDLKDKISRPYFRDWSNLSHHQGKTFIAPPRIFKADLSLYFPNLYGQTLLKSDRKAHDTTPALTGRISVVSVFSGTWAEYQADSFVSPKANPALAEVLARHPDVCQRVRINIEEDAFKAFLVWLFMGRIRSQIDAEDWGRYFVVRRGVSDEIREGTGMLNSKVGYTYLVDPLCRIRWAGSGPAEEHEREGLVKGIQRLITEDQGDIVHKT